MRERFKATELKPKEPESPPSAFSRFFTALFTCGVNQKEQPSKDDNKAGGCCTGKGSTGSNDERSNGTGAVLPSH